MTADVDVSEWHRIWSASIGALITSLLVTPLDVTKTRMQIQKTDGIGCELCEEDFKRYQAAHTDVKNVKINLNVNNSSNPSVKRPIKVSKINQNYYIFSNGLMDHQLPTSRLRIFEHPCNHQIIFKNSFDAFYKIARYEGIPHLYTGLGVTLWMAVPATVLYYSTYDVLKNALLKFIDDRNSNGQSTKTLSTFMPLISGMTGRVFAATLVSPLELMRTQMMARTIDKDLKISQALRLNLRDGGISSLWKGLIPTLWRDVPFSGIYWMSYEYYKKQIICRNVLNNSPERTEKYDNDSIGQWNLFMASFLSGALSGSIATLCTQPFDVLKTRRQSVLLGITNGNNSTQHTKLLSLGTNIVKNEGVSALFLGLPARITRVPIACAIMVSVFEVGKVMLKTTAMLDT